MRKARFLHILVPFVLGALSVSLPGCKKDGTPLVVTDAPRIGSLFMMLGMNDPQLSPKCDIRPLLPPLPEPAAWWSALDPQTRLNKVVVGYEFWSNSNAGCLETRHVVYRGVASYDLATVQALSTASNPIQSLITSATVRLVFDPSVPSPVAIGTCLADYGGLGAIEELRPGYTVLSGLTVVFPNQFPPGAQRTALATIPVPGSSGRLSTSRGAGGLTVIDIDVKDLLLGALNRRDATFGLMLDATSETLLTTTAKPQAVCRTFVEVGSLTVGHL